MTSAESEWLTTPQAAELAGVSYHTFWRWIVTGQGPVVYRPGRDYRVRRSDLDQFLENWTTQREIPGDAEGQAIAENPGEGPTAAPPAR